MSNHPLVQSKALVDPVRGANAFARITAAWLCYFELEVVKE